MSATRWPWPRVVAHRGGGMTAPENTLAAIRAGVEHGFRAVEFDAMLARDQIPVLMHDSTLQRTGGRAAAIASLSAAELAEVDVGRWHSPAFAGEVVPTLAQALALCRREQVWPNVEIKPTLGFDEATGAAVARVVAQAYGDVLQQRPKPAQLPLLSSFSEAALQTARIEAPQLPRALLVDAVPADWQMRLAALGATALHVDHRQLTSALAAQVIAAGYGLFCYTVNEPSRMRELFGWGVDAICTDRIDLIGPNAAER